MVVLLQGHDGSLAGQWPDGESYLPEVDIEPEGTFVERTVLVKNIGGWHGTYPAAQDEAAGTGRTFEVEMAHQRWKWLRLALEHGHVRDVRCGFYEPHEQDTEDAFVLIEYYSQVDAQNAIISGVSNIYIREVEGHEDSVWHTGYLIWNDFGLPGSPFDTEIDDLRGLHRLVRRPHAIAIVTPSSSSITEPDTQTLPYPPETTAHAVPESPSPVPVRRRLQLEEPDDL